MAHRPSGTNLGMARVGAPIRGAMLLFVVLLSMLAAAVPTLGAETRDPRCDAWEAASAPPGIDMAAVCPPAAISTEAVELDKEPLVPYVIGLVVMGVVLGAVGVVAMRVMSPRPRRRASTAAEWWACPSCGAGNRPDRAHCFSCEAARDAQQPPTPAEDPHPA